MRYLFSILAFWPLLVGAQPSQLLGVSEFNKWSPAGTPPAGCPSGAPKVFGTLTNGYCGATNQIGVTMPTFTSGCALDLIFVTLVSATYSQPNVTNNGVAATLLTNIWWYDSTAKSYLFYTDGPAQQSRLITARWGGDVDEAMILVVTLTNKASSSMFNTVVTNFTSDLASSPIVNTISSGTGELAMGFATEAQYTLDLRADGGAMTFLTSIVSGETCDGSYCWATNGAASVTVTLDSSSSSARRCGCIGVSIRGVP